VVVGRAHIWHRVVATQDWFAIEDSGIAECVARKFGRFGRARKHEQRSIVAREAIAGIACHCERRAKFHVVLTAIWCNNTFVHTAYTIRKGCHGAFHRLAFKRNIPSTRCIGRVVKRTLAACGVEMAGVAAQDVHIAANSPVAIVTHN